MVSNGDNTADAFTIQKIDTSTIEINNNASYSIEVILEEVACYDIFIDGSGQLEYEILEIDFLFVNRAKDNGLEKNFYLYERMKKSSDFNKR